jgi:TP901 family phage tail tape measure protein
MGAAGRVNLGQINVNLGNAGNAARNTANNIQLAGNEIENFGRQAGLAIRRFAAFSVVTGVVFGITNAFKNGVSAFIEYDQQLTRISQVTGDAKESLGKINSTISELSTSLGVSSKELAATSVTLAQAGLTARDTETALKALALSALAPSFDDMNQTVEGSIALMRQFGISSKELEGSLGSINAVAAKFAVEASDIITAIQRTGGVFAAAGKGVSEGTNALNEFIAVFTSIRATTRESAETIATGLRTIFTRIQRADTIEALKEFGVTLTDLEGKFVGPYIAVQRLSEGLSKLDPRDLSFSRIVEELGGFRQIGKVLPLIQQFATAQDALRVAQQGQGSLSADAAKGQMALAIQIAKVREEFLALIRSVGNTDSFQNMVKVGLDLASALIKVADAAKGLIPLVGLFAAFRGAQAITQFAGGFGRGFRGAPTQRASEGGPIRHFASGGYVPGFGNGDTVSAKLTPGEFVMSKPAVRSIGVGNLSRMNKGDRASKFDKGGPVTVSALLTRSGGPSIRNAINTTNLEPDDTVSINIVPKQVPLNQTDFLNIWLRGNSSAKKGTGKFKNYAGINVSQENRDRLKNLAGKNTKQQQEIKRGYGAGISEQVSMLQSAEGRWGLAYEEFLINKLRANWTKASSKNNYPVDLVQKLTNNSIKRIGEVKFRTTPTEDIDLISKLLRYRIERGSINRYFRENEEIPKDLDKNIGSLDYFWAGNYKKQFYKFIEERQKIQAPGFVRAAAGGQIQRFPRGGNVQKLANVGVTKEKKQTNINETAAQALLEQNAGKSPVIRRILSKPKAGRDFAQILKKQGVTIPPFPKFVGSGMANAVFDIGNKKMLKVSLTGFGDNMMAGNFFGENVAEKMGMTGNYQLPMGVPGVAGYSSHIDAGVLSSAIQDKAVMKIKGRSKNKDANELIKRLRKQEGLTGIDLHNDNIGYRYNPKTKKQEPAIIDGLVVHDDKLPPGFDFSNRFKIGGEVQRFPIGGEVRRTKKERYKKISVADAEKLSASQIITGLTTGQSAPARVGGMDVVTMRKILGQRNRTPDDQRKRDEILNAYTRRINGEVDQRLGVTKQRQTAGLLFGIAGLYGSPFAPTDMVVGDKGELTKPTTVQVMGGVPRKKLMDRANLSINDLDIYGKDFKKSVKKGAKRLLVSDILSQLGLGKALYADFDRTLVFGADDLPDIQSFNDKRKVGRQLLSKKARLSVLGQKLRDLLVAKPQLTPSVKILTARPRSTLGLLQAFLRRQNLNIPSSQFTGVGGNNLNEAAIAKLKAAELPSGSVLVDDNAKNIRAAELKSKALKAQGEAGITTFRYKSARSPLDKPGEDTAAGLAFQESLRGLLSEKRAVAAFAETGGKSIDFPLGLGRRAALFGLKPNIPTDAKRTLTGPSTAKENITNYLKARSYSAGGDIQKFPQGGTPSPGGHSSNIVPALVSTGEAYFPPEEAKNIGLDKLRKMNQADRNGMKSFARGGVSVFRGPGSGTSDSIGPIGLPVGSFIVRAAATKALGLSSGGSVGNVQKFAAGGAAQRLFVGGLLNPPPAARPDLGGMNDSEARRVVGVVNSVNQQLGQLAGVLEELGVASGDTARLMQRGSQATYAQAIQATEADIRRARIAGASAQQIAAAESVLRDIRQQADRDIRARRASVDTPGGARASLGSLGGQDLQRIDSRADQLRQQMMETERNRLQNQTVTRGGRTTARYSNEQVEERLQRRAGRFNRQSYEQATTQVTGGRVDLGAVGLTGDDAQRYIQQSMRDRNTLAQMDRAYIPRRAAQIRQQLEAERGVGATARERAALARQALRMAEQEARDRANTARAAARAAGAAGPGGGPESGMARSMGMAFGLQMVGSLLAQQINPESSSSNAQISAGLQGGTNMLATGTMIGSGVMEMFPAMTRLLGPITILTTVALAAGQALIDARNAAIEFEKKLADKRVQDAMERVGQGFDKLSKNIKDIKIQDDITNNLIEASRNVRKSVEADKTTAKAFWANITDVFTSNTSSNLAEAAQNVYNSKPAAGRTDADRNALAAVTINTQAAAASRSKILEKEGVSAYLSTTSMGQFLSGAGSQSSSRAEERRSSLSLGMIPETAREDSKKYVEVAQSMQRIIEDKLRSGLSVRELLTAPKHEFEQIARTMAMADQATHANILAIQQDTNLTTAEKEAKIKNIATLYAEDKIRKSAKSVDTEKASKNFEKNINNMSRSLERMFQNMDQAIERTSFSLRQMSQDMDLISASLGGQAKTGDTSLKSMNILQNPRAYGGLETNAARDQASSFFTGERNLVKGLLSVGDNLETSIMSSINKTLTDNPAASNEQIGINIEKQVTKQIAKLQLPPDVGNKLGEQVKTALDEMRKRGDENLNFDDLMEKIPGLSKVLESGKRAQESALKALEHWQSSLNSYSEKINQLIDLQIDTNERLRRSSELVIRGNMEVSRALGKDVSVSSVRSARNVGIAQQTGGLTDADAIAKNIMSLEGQRRSLESSANSAGNRGLAGANDFVKFKSGLLDTNVALRENIAALKSLAENGDVASAALGKIQEAQQKQASKVGFIEKLVTSTPEEVNSLERAMARLQNNINGQLNTINNSVGAQKAYNDAIAQGATNAEAMSAAQVAFAGERKETLGALNDLLPFLSNNQQGNNIKANVLESMARESGVGINPMMQEVINSLRNPQADPQTQAAMQQYQQAISEQARANTLLAQLNSTLANDIATKSAAALSQALTGASIKFQSSQLDDIAKNVRSISLRGGDQPVPAAGKANGGMIYAAAGTMVNFQPKGTDTVPAMLTPGEFVVNRAATSRNLPLLQSINSGGYSKGGSVNYYSSGGYVSSVFKSEYLDSKNLENSEKQYIDPEDKIIKDIISGDDKPFMIRSGWKNFTRLQSPANQYHSAQFKKTYVGRVGGYFGFGLDETNDKIPFETSGKLVPGSAPIIDINSIDGEYVYKNTPPPNLWPAGNRELGYLLSDRKFNTKNIAKNDLSKYRDIINGLISVVPPGRVWGTDPSSFEFSSPDDLSGGQSGFPYNPNLSSAKPVGLILSRGATDIGQQATESTDGIQKIFNNSRAFTGQSEEASDRAGNTTRIYGDIQGTVSAGKLTNAAKLAQRGFINDVPTDNDTFKWITETKKISELRDTQKENLSLLKNTTTDIFGNKINWLKNTEKNNKLISLQQKLQKIYEGGSLIEDLDVSERELIDNTQLRLDDASGKFSLLSKQLEPQLAKRVAELSSRPIDQQLPKDKENARIATLTRIGGAAGWADGDPFPINFSENGLTKPTVSFPWIANIEPEFFLQNIKEQQEQQAKDRASGKDYGFNISSLGLQPYAAKLPAPLDKVSFNYKAAYTKYSGRLFDLRQKELDNTRPLNDAFIIDPKHDDALNIFKNANFPDKSFFTGFPGPYQPQDLAKRISVKDPQSILDYMQALRNNDPNADALAGKINGVSLALGPALLKVMNDKPLYLPDDLYYGIDNTFQNLDISPFVVASAKDAAGQLGRLAKEKSSQINTPGSKTQSISEADLGPTVQRIAQASLGIFGRRPGIPSGYLYSQFGRALSNISDPIKAKNTASGISGVFSNLVKQIHGMAPRNSREFAALRDSNILATGASAVFNKLASGSTNYIKSFLGGGSSIENLFRSLGSGSFFNEMGSQQFSEDFTKQLGADLKGSKLAKIGADGSIDLTDMNEQDVPKNYQGLVDLAINPYHEFGNRSVRQGIFQKLMTDIPNFRANHNVTDPKTGTILEKRQTQLPLFGPAALKMIMTNLNNLSQWYGGNGAWAGQDYLNENDPATTPNERAEFLASNFDGALYTTATEAHRQLGGLANFGDIPNREWLMARGQAKMPDMKPVVKLATGGMVYASNGQYVNFQPRGTDTVPAMLTPGEFVVNRSATQQNLPLLRAINNGADAYSMGGVVYAAGGFDPSRMAQGAYPSQSTSPKPSMWSRMFGARNPGAFRPRGMFPTFGGAVGHMENGLHKAFVRTSGWAGRQVGDVGRAFGNIGHAPIRPTAILNQLTQWQAAQQGAMFPASTSGAAYQRMQQNVLKQLAQYSSAATNYNASNTLLARAGRGATSLATKAVGGTAAFNSGINILTEGSSALYGFGNAALGGRNTYVDSRREQAAQTNNTILGGAATGFMSPITTMAQMGFTVAELNETRRRASKGESLNSEGRKISVSNIANRQYSGDERHLSGLTAVEATYIRQIINLEKALAKEKVGTKRYDQLQQNLNDAKSRNVTEKTRGMLWGTTKTTSRKAGLSSGDDVLDKAIDQHREYEVRLEAQRVAQAAAEKAEEARLKAQQQQAEAQNRTRAAVTVVSNAGQAAYNFGVSMFNKFKEDRKNAINADRSKRTAAASQYLDKPAVPDLIKDSQTFRDERQAAIDEVRRLDGVYQQESQLNKNRGDSEAELKRLKDSYDKEREAALAAVAKVDSKIIDRNKEAEKLSPDERQAAWKSYNDNQAKTAKDEALAQARYQSRVAKTQLKKQADGQLAIAEITRVPRPTKDMNPESFFRWSENARKTLNRKFKLSGNDEKDMAILSAAGLSPEIAKEVIQPISKENSSLLLEMMSTSGKYSKQELGLLQLSGDQIEQLTRASSGMGGSATAQMTLDERNKVLKKQRGLAVKTQKQLSRIEKQIEAAERLGPEGRIRRQSAIQQQLLRQGLVSASQDGPANQARLEQLGMNKERVGFIFQQQGNQQGAPANGMSNGGVVYAAGGTLIPYSPRGTDTVPAMLTPGEFVVNAKATSQNLPLLQSINKSSGGVIYRAEGGGSDAFSNRQPTSSAEKSGSIRATELNTRLQQQIANNTKNTADTVPTIAKITSETANKQIPTLSNKTSSLEQNNAKAFSNINTKATDINKITSTIPQFDKTANEKLDELLRRTEGLPETVAQIVTLIIGDIQQRQPGGNFAGFGLNQGPNAIQAINDAIRNRFDNILNAAALQMGRGFSSGGMVYASNGMMIPYEPRGTDTVPAMLTPGEFVVNRVATQANLPLLQAINKSKGGNIKKLAEGGVVYAATGGTMPTKPDGSADTNFDARKAQRKASLERQIRTQEEKEFKKLGILYNDTTDKEDIIQALKKQTQPYPYPLNIDYYLRQFSRDKAFDIDLKRFPRISEAAKSILAKQEQPKANPFDMGQQPAATPQSLSRGGVVYASGGGEMTKIPEPPIAMPFGFAPQKGFAVPLDKTKAIQAHQQSEKYPDPFTPEADRAWRQFDLSPVESMADDAHEFLQEKLGGNKQIPLNGPPMPFGVGPRARHMDNTVAGQLQGLYYSLIPDNTKGGQGLENYLDQYKNHFAPNAPYGAQPILPNKDSLMPQMKAKGGVVYAQEGFDPSRPLNPMMNRQGKGSASTLTSSPISNFNNEKLAEEGKAFMYGAAKSVLPGLAGLGAGLLGLPTTGPGGFAIGLGAGTAVYQAQENYLNAFAPETNRQMKDITEEHWQASLLGSIASGFGVDKAGRKLLSPFMKNTLRMPATLPNNNASVRPDIKSASQEAMEEFSLRSRPAASAPLDVPKADKALPLLRSLEEKGVIKTTQSSSTSKFNSDNRRDLYQIDQILYHGTGHTIDDIDPSKGGGILGGGFYTGFEGHEGIAARFAAMGKANKHVYPVRVSGGIGDFPEATETLGGNSKILSVIEKLFTEQNLSRQTRQFSGKWGKTGPIYDNVDLNLKDMTFKDVVDLLKNRYSETIKKTLEQENGISLSKISPQEIATRADKLGEEQVRQLLVKAGIPGAKDTTGKLSGTGEPMVSIYDQSRLSKEGKPFVPNSLKPQMKANGGVIYAQDGMRIPFNLNDIADKNPAKVGYSTSAEERYMERWKKTHTDLLADPSEGPGMLGAPFHERFSAGLNMLADIGSAKMAGAKATGARGQKFASVPRSGRSMRKPPTSIVKPSAPSVGDLKALQYSQENIPNLLGDGERPLFSKDFPKTVKPKDIEAKLAQDRTEIESIAKLLSERLGRPVDPVEAKDMLVKRMTDMMIEAKSGEDNMKGRTVDSKTFIISSSQGRTNRAFVEASPKASLLRKIASKLSFGKIDRLSPKQQLDRDELFAIQRIQSYMYDQLHPERMGGLIIPSRKLSFAEAYDEIDSLQPGKYGYFKGLTEPGGKALKNLLSSGRIDKETLMTQRKQVSDKLISEGKLDPQDLPEARMAEDPTKSQMIMQRVNRNSDMIIRYQGNDVRLNPDILKLADKGVYQSPVTTNDPQQQIYPTSPLDFYQKFMAPQNKSSGGVIYASTGTLVNYQPRGTDTVPAMLTPGEFVVNRASTQKHLPLLQSINSGNYENGGIVSYYRRGGRITAAELASNRREYLDRKKAEKKQRDDDKKAREDNFAAARQQQIEDRRARSTSGISVQTRGGSYARSAMSSSQAQPNQPQQTAQSTIAQAIINVAQAAINIANATTSSSSSNNNQTGTPSYMTSSINGPRTQRTQDFFEARRINRNSREQEENDRTLYRRRNRRPSDTTAYSNALASRNTPVAANNQNSPAQNSIFGNLLQAIQSMFGSAQTATRGAQNQQTGTPRYLTSSINTPGVQRTQEFFEMRRINQEAQQAERDRRNQRAAVAQAANSPNVPSGQNPAQNNNIWTVLNNNALQFSNALNTATTALNTASAAIQQYNQQLAGGVSNKGNPDKTNLDGISLFTSTFQSFIDQLKNINPVINMRGNHTVTVNFGSGADVFARMEGRVKEFVIDQINAGLNNVNTTLRDSTEGSIDNVRNLA